MQTVSLSLRVLHRPEVEKLPIIYSKLGKDYEERVLPSIGNEVLKAVVAQFDASELITQREIVTRIAFCRYDISHFYRRYLQKSGMNYLKEQRNSISFSRMFH